MTGIFVIFGNFCREKGSCCVFIGEKCQKGGCGTEVLFALYGRRGYNKNREGKGFHTSTPLNTIPRKKRRNAL